MPSFKRHTNQNEVVADDLYQHSSQALTDDDHGQSAPELARATSSSEAKDERDECSEDGSDGGEEDSPSGLRFEPSSFHVGEDGCSGWLLKFSIGKSRIFGRSNWKRRFFVLASLGNAISLGYYEDERATKLVGSVVLDRSSTRIVTRPTTMTHPKAAMLGRDLCVVYYGDNGGTELKLLLRAADEEEHHMWGTALAQYFAQVDVARDYPC